VLGGIGLIVILASRILDNAVVDSLVKVPADKEAAHRAFTIGTTLLYDIAIALITYGLVIVVAAWIAGRTRPAQAVRRALAPSLREHVAYVYAAAALALLLVVIWGPFPSTRQPIPVIGIAILLVLGIQALSRMVAQEFPDAKVGDTARSIRIWYAARLHSAFSAARPVPAYDGQRDPRIADLERLASLHHRGDLTDAEFRAQKAIVLNRGT
jgi:hypothetical protein